MISSLIGRLNRKLNSEHKICLKQLKPKGFTNTISNMGKGHHLRLWYLENSPNHDKRLQYLREIEVLHDEMNIKAGYTMVMRSLMLGAGVFLYYFIWAGDEDDTYDFSPQIDYKQSTRAGVGLEDGGFEVVS